MKKLHTIYGFILFIIFSAFSCRIQGQNLVPNCSFEDTVFCPNFLSEINACKDWYSAGYYPQSSPDYFNSCDKNNGYREMGVPSNIAGFQYAANGGNAYAGIIPWLKNGTDQGMEAKEFIGTRLLEPLTIGQRYYVSFLISLAAYQSGYASNKSGILFSTKRYDNENPAPVKNFAHIYTNKIIADTGKWTTISGWMTADSAYQYISIGDFFDNIHIDTAIFNKASNYYSYYFIDDVCVSLDSTKCSCNYIDNIKENKPKSSITVYYNTETKKINIINMLPFNDIMEARIYDITGRKVKNQKSKIKNEANKQTLTVDTSELNEGIYFVNVSTEGFTKTEKFVVTR